MVAAEDPAGPSSAFESTTFDKDVSIYVKEDIGAASISPSGRDIVLANSEGLTIIDLDNPYSTPRHIFNRTRWEVADVQWSPFASRADWIASTCNQKALIYNLGLSTSASKAPIEHVLHAHERAITDINFSAHHPDILATCAVDSYVFSWDLRAAWEPVMRFADFESGATQVKWNRKNEHIIASSHDKYLYIWDQRKGAQPVATINAHVNKIYGIDWHRLDSHKILTCSLDKTIKLWDFGSSKHQTATEELQTPERVIRSHYPVWRARHTPFNNGILAMPQLGSSALTLYAREAQGEEDPTIATPAAHVFTAHDEDARVREFLWRSRGSMEDGRDEREFQLVTWGSDQNLHLHSITPELLEKAVGYKKGELLTDTPRLTRSGAKYVTYRDDPLPRFARQPVKDSFAESGPASSTLSSLIFRERSSQQGKVRPRNLQQTKDFPTMYEHYRTTMTAAKVGVHNHRRVVDQINWLDGVKVGERGAGRDGNSYSTPASTLQDELSNVGTKYSKVEFESIDITRRRAIVSFEGPWGAQNGSEDKKLVFIRLDIKFPVNYPSISHIVNDDDEKEEQLSPLKIDFEKTTAAIDSDIQSKLHNDMQWIADSYAARGLPALEAVICYGLGERDLEESLALPADHGRDHDVPDLMQPTDVGVEAESSSDDDEDDEVGPDNDLMNSAHTNANVPRPIETTARFSALGCIVVARVPAAPTSRSLFSEPARLALHSTNRLRKNEIFDTFGRLHTTRANKTNASTNEEESPTSSMGSWDSSSSASSSSSGNDTGAALSMFKPPLAWQKATLRFQTRASHPSSASAALTVNPKSTVSILGPLVEDLVPSKRYLAEEYIIFGDGPSVCLHNAEVARRHGHEELADVWDLCRLILNDEVPLDILPQQHRREQVLVLARRALVRIKRKDSGLDLQFDEAESVTNPKLKGRIKWGHHAVVRWLIPQLFEHFEQVADTQMLAMLSCIFSEPAAREGVTSATAKVRQSHLPMSMEAPAFSLDYFSSAEAAWSLFKPTISAPSVPAYSRFATPVNDFEWRGFKTLDTYGSHGSSNGPWGSDLFTSEPVTPYSTGNTPPYLSKNPTLRSTSHTPFSSSPEERALKKASTGNFANAIATLSRPFQNASSSPQVKSRNESELSTSALASGVTWGTTTFYSSGSNDRSAMLPRNKYGKRPSFGQATSTNLYVSDSDSEYDDGVTMDGVSEYTTPISPAGAEGDANSKIRVTLKNQDRFDDEACVSAPLLDMSKEWLYRAWREQYAEMLGCWGLVSKRAEVLKFNGLISYFPHDASERPSKAGSVHLTLRGEGAENASNQTSGSLSRVSTLAPPQMAPHQRLSPKNSPRDFSFNPEALEFRPSTAFVPEMGLPPEVFITHEQSLRLSIPAPSGDTTSDLSMLQFDGLGHSKTRSRPSMSRATSSASKASAMQSGKKKEPIHSCGICWIRVEGRFYYCPGCGHVAHVECIPPATLDGERIWSEWGECVVGCGCECGEQPIQEETVHRIAWDERGSWMPQDAEGYAYQEKLQRSQPQPQTQIIGQRGRGDGRAG